jgi:hypothetical protein
MKKTYNISKEFTDLPGGRYIKDGKFSGEEFRKTKLRPMLEKCIETGDILEINFDGTFGYPPSFLEEAFGGLFREEKISKELILKHISFISKNDKYLVEEIKKYIREAKQ